MTGKIGYQLSIPELGSRGKDGSPPSVSSSTPVLVHNDWEGKVDFQGRDFIADPASVGECSCHTRGGSWIG